jgi:hypothetical protein
MQQSKNKVNRPAYETLELRYNKLRETTKDLREEGRKLRKRIKSLEASRKSWKDKAVDRKEELSSLEKRFYRSKENKGEVHAKGHHYPMWLIKLSIILRIYCHCSYGSIKKIIEVLKTDYFIECKKESTPCEKTLQNWVSKVGYFYLKNPDNQSFGEDVALIIDESVRVSSQKLLLALLIPVNKQSSESLSFEDVQVFSLEGSESWTGEKIAKKIQAELNERNLNLKYVVSDEGNNMKCAVRLLGVPHIPDISHAVGTCLKKSFKELEEYKELSASLTIIKARLGLCEHSFLRPPKQRTKSRFLNQEKIVKWVQTILKKWEEIPPTAQEKLLPIQDHKVITKELEICISIAEKISKMLKTNGLSIKKIDDALEYIRQQKLEHMDEKGDSICENYKNIIIFIDYLKAYLEKYKAILVDNDWEKQSIHICSDVIERLFGRYKAKISDNFFVTVSSIALEIPLMCLSRQKIMQNVQLALETVKMTTIREWRTEQSSHNQVSMRAQFFNR